jgi:pimeloyl-ACP methyl ester carboxylesterase
MGGAILGQFLAQSPLADRVGAVALDSPALSFSAVIDHLATSSGKPLSGASAWLAERLLPYLTSLPLSQAEVSGAFAAFSGPIFIAHGSGDRIAPIGPSQALAAARPDAVTLWTKADHLGSFAEDPAAYKRAFSGSLVGLSN